MAFVSVTRQFVFNAKLLNEGNKYERGKKSEVDCIHSIARLIRTDFSCNMLLKEHHGLLDRYRFLLEACDLNSVSEEDYIDLGKAGLGSCLPGGLPDWLSRGMV